MAVIFLLAAFLFEGDVTSVKTGQPFPFLHKLLPVIPDNVIATLLTNMMQTIEMIVWQAYNTSEESHVALELWGIFELQPTAVSHLRLGII